jgi:hypothetical protein
VADDADDRVREADVNTHSYPYRFGHWTRRPSVVRAATRRFHDWFSVPAPSADEDGPSDPPEHRGDSDLPEDS